MSAKEGFPPLPESKSLVGMPQGKKCVCGKPVLHIPSDSTSAREADSVDSKKQNVFDRLYAHRVKKEQNRRKLVEELSKEEARSHTYIPRTNHLHQALRTTSSLSTLEDREKRLARARKEYKEGRLCDDCFKKTEVGIGAYQMEDLVSVSCDQRLWCIPVTNTFLAICRLEMMKTFPGWARDQGRPPFCRLLHRRSTFCSP